MPNSNQLTKPIGFPSGPLMVPVKSSAAPTATDFTAGQFGIHHQTAGGRGLVYNNSGTLYGIPFVPVASLYRRATETWLVATGTPATDLANFIAAKNALVAAGGGELVIDGVHNWPNVLVYENIDASIRVRFTKGSKLVAYPGSGSRLDIGGSADPLTSGTAISGGVTRFASDFAQSGSCAAGDYLAMWSTDDLVAEVVPNSVGGVSSPGELRRVLGVEGTRVILDAPVADALTTTPLLKKLTMHDGVVWEGGTIENMTVVAIQLANARFENMRFINCGTVGIGAFNFVHCYNCTFSGCVVDNTGVTMGIGVTVGMCSDIDIFESLFLGSGHAFSTGRGKQSGLDETGGLRAVKFRDNKIHAFRNATGGNQPLDTHSLGYDMWFDRNDIYLSGYINGGAQTAVTGAIRVRCRKVRATRNKIMGPAVGNLDTASWGINADGAGGVVCEGNIYSRLAGGIYVFDPFGGHTIKNEIFDELTHLGLRIDQVGSAGRTHVQDCVFRLNTGRGFSAEPKTWIWTTNTANVSVTNCQLSKSGNTYSLKADMSGGELDPGEGVRIRGCTCEGYGAGNDGTTGAGIDVNDNFTD